MTECYFLPNKKSTSATICQNCGQEKHLHTIGEGLKVSGVQIITTPTMTREQKLKQELEDILKLNNTDFKSKFKDVAEVVLSTPSILRHADPEIMKQAGWVREEEIRQAFRSGLAKGASEYPEDHYTEDEHVAFVFKRHINNKP